MVKRLFISFFIVLSLFSTPTKLLAQENQELDSIWNNWNFRISPYFWYIGFQGIIYKPPELTTLPEPHLPGTKLMWVLRTLKIPSSLP